MPDWGRANEPRVKQAYDWLDAHLADQPYCAGGRYTIVDITALCAIDFAKFARVGIEARHKNLAAWYAKVSARPSALA